MFNSVCEMCGNAVVQPVASGRRRKFCLDCRPSKAAAYSPVAKVSSVCVCGESFMGDGRRKFCSNACRERAKSHRSRTVACDSCSRPVSIGGKSASSPRCRTCRAPKHGEVAMYDKRKCRCGSCRAAKAQSMKEYAQRRAASGRPLNRGGSWISRTDRSYIYLRDDLVCQLCQVRVNLDVHHMDPLAPTVDHIVPRSLGGSNDLENLRLACRQCNSSRGANVNWSPHGVEAGNAQMVG